MNRSIFGKENNKGLIILNYKTQKNIIFAKYVEVAKYQCLEMSSKPEVFVNKINSHWNAKFKIHVFCADKLNCVGFNYLTCNTNVYNKDKCEYIGKTVKGKSQFVNYDYQLFTTEQTDSYMKKLRDKDNLEISNNIHELLINSNKIPVIEKKLNMGVEFFNSCIKKTQKFHDCYQTLSFDYGENAELIAKLFFHKYI